MEPAGPARVVIPIEGGTKSAAFAATGVIKFQGRVICTGTLVAPDKVLSAAHCFMDAPSYAIPQAVFMLDHKGQTLSAKLKSVTSHPSFSSKIEPPSKHDMAVIRLATQITKVLPVVLSLDDPTGLVGQKMILVGFGRSETNPHNVRREAEVVLAEVLANNIAYEFNGSGACVGDSGGPAFVKLPDGWRQVGITSGGATSNTCRVKGYYSRLDVDAAWLKQQGIDGANRPRKCTSEGTCDGVCYADVDCTGAPDPCAADGTCNASCGSDPDCQTAPSDPCAADGTCNASCGSDPDCHKTPPPAPTCHFVTRVFKNKICYYYDYYTGHECGAYWATCYPQGCYCPF